MSPNPLLSRLGLSDNGRAIIFHADDIGMCHATVAAYPHLLDAGLITSAAFMVPCSWFPATAAFVRENSARYPQIDVGVHLTLTCEWDAYRWGSLTSRQPEDGLIDEEGAFWRTSQAVQEKAEISAVEAELQTQMAQAQAAGLDVTHIDSHMGTLFHPRFLGSYVALAQAHRLPALMLRADALSPEERNSPDSAETVAWLRQLEASGFPLLDSVQMMPLHRADGKLELTKQILDSLPAGVHYFIIHPAQDTPELRAIAPDWQARVADYELFTSDALAQAIDASGVKPIGWAAIGDLLRAS